MAQAIEDMGIQRGAATEQESSTRTARQSRQPASKKRVVQTQTSGAELVFPTLSFPTSTP